MTDGRIVSLSEFTALEKDCEHWKSKVRENNIKLLSLGVQLNLARATIRELREQNEELDRDYRREQDWNEWMSRQGEKDAEQLLRYQYGLMDQVEVMKLEDRIDKLRFKLAKVSRAARANGIDVAALLKARKPKPKKRRPGKKR